MMVTNLLGKKTTSGDMIVVVESRDNTIQCWILANDGSLYNKDIRDVVVETQPIGPVTQAEAVAAEFTTPSSIDDLVLEALKESDGMSPSELAGVPRLKSSGARLPDIRGSLDRITRAGKAIERARRWYIVKANFQFD